MINKQLFSENSSTTNFDQFTQHFPVTLQLEGTDPGTGGIRITDSGTTAVRRLDAASNATGDATAIGDNEGPRSNHNSEAAPKLKAIDTIPKMKKRNLFVLLGSFLFVPVAFLAMVVVVVLLAPIVGDQEY
ncbi:hypothetical protein [Anabaena sp. UHCC 0451]|uniref:hypothetical protein n=1 Tax=Anabaena sp. UHCC 0451 TaxID=2055235 RepID=UPI002B1EA7A2|nr:hypothetical protein [Anabaena sp. UHCC 0451]MEA5577998.1 hypothetical protein [Anabaena sp. UHCC 0451]